MTENSTKKTSTRNNKPKTVSAKRNTTPKASASKKTSTPKAPAPLKDLPRNPFAFEVLQLASSQRTIAKKVEVLKKYECPSIKAILIWNFDESIVSALPPGEVPKMDFDEAVTTKTTFTEKLTHEVRHMYETGNFSLGASDKDGHTTIKREFKHFYRFLKGGQDSLSSLRRESMFINILEGLHPLEAEILCLIKDKQLETKYKITKEVVSKAYPDIRWGNRV